MCWIVLILFLIFKTKKNHNLFKNHENLMIFLIKKMKSRWMVDVNISYDFKYFQKILFLKTKKN